VARLVFIPFGSWIADRAPNRRSAIILFAAVALAIFVPATLVVGAVPIMILSGLALTISGMVMPALDALALTGLRRFGIDYGRVRVWGSLSFVVVSMAGGLIFGHFGAGALSPLLISAFAVAAAGAFALPVTPPRIRAIDDAARAFYNFSSIHWEGLGFTGGNIGFLWAVGVVAEMGMFTFAGSVRRVGAERLILIGAIAALVRWALFPLATGLAFSALLQCLHAFTFAGVFFGTQLAIAKTVPEEMTASAQGIYQVVSGLLLAFSTLISGPFYTRFGSDSFYLSTIFPLLAIAILALRRWPRFSPKGAAPAD
jgi:PPP family 3-phenylpropionic acid transporter